MTAERIREIILSTPRELHAELIAVLAARPAAMRALLAAKR